MATAPKQNQSTRLAYLRQTLGFTVREVGEAVGRSYSRITDWESDPNIRIKPSVLDKLAKLYKVTPDFIRYGEEGPPKETKDLARSVVASRLSAEAVHNTAEILGTVADMQYVTLPFVRPAAYATFAANCQDYNKEDLDTFHVLMRPGVDYKDAVVIEVRGNSMAPRYPDRSCYVVRPVSDGNWQYATGVHAVSLRSAMFVIKRITSNREGVLMLTSDNGGAEMSVELGDILCMWKVGEAAYMPAED